MDLRTLLKYGLIAAAGYLAYRQFSTSVPAATDGDTPASPGGSPSTPVTPSPQPTRSGAWLESFHSATVANEGKETLTVDEWNWYFNRATGLTMPAPEDFGFTAHMRFAPVHFAVWWSMLLSHFPEFE